MKKMKRSNWRLENENGKVRKIMMKNEKKRTHLLCVRKKTPMQQISHWRKKRMKIIKLTPASQTEAATATINLTPAELVAVNGNVWMKCAVDWLHVVWAVGEADTEKEWEVDVHLELAIASGVIPKYDAEAFTKMCTQA